MRKAIYHCRLYLLAWPERSGVQISRVAHVQTYFDQLQILMCMRECCPTSLNPHRCFEGLNLNAEVLGVKLLIIDKIGVHQENRTQIGID